MTMLWTIVFNVLIHAILLGAMGLFVVVLVRLTLSTYDSMERVKRVLALFAGAMVIVGAQASGLNFAEFMARALSVGRASSAAAAIVSSIVAGIAGLGIGYLLVRLFRQHNELAVRIICLVGMLSLSAFIQSYATITAASGVFLGATGRRPAVRRWARHHGSLAPDSGGSFLHSDPLLGRDRTCATWRACTRGARPDS